MGLIYITNVRMPTEKAHGIQIAKMCEAFGNLINSLILVLPTKKNFNNNNIYQYYGVKNNFEVIKLETVDPVFLLRFPIGTYIKIQTLFFIFSIYKFLRKQNINQNDILYTRDQYLMPVLFVFSKKIVWEAHDLPKRKKYYVKYWKKCYKIIAITQGLKNDLMGLGIDENKIMVAPDGVDLSKFDFDDSQEELRKEINLPLDKKIALYSGHLYDWKGADVFAQSAEFLDENILAVFLGGTDKDIENFKNKYGGKQNILILGRVDSSQVPKYLKAADVLVLPNSAKKEISVRYTSPLKLFEYMAVGKPIVASELPSIKEVLDESSAVFFEPDNSGSLADSINKILSDNSLSENIANKAVNDSLAYSWDKRAKSILNFLKVN